MNLKILPIFLSIYMTTCFAFAEPEVGELSDSEQDKPHHHDTWVVLPLIIGTMGILAFAPPMLLPFVKENSSATEMPSSRDHVGLFAAGELQNNYLSHAESVEFRKDHIYGEIRTEHLVPEETYQITSLRIGYFFATQIHTYGGVIVGYRSGSQIRNGPEVGLPIFVGSHKGTLRFEPIYLLLSDRIAYNYRFQADLNIPGTKMTAGVIVERRWLNETAPFSDSEGIIVGAIF